MIICVNSWFQLPGRDGGDNIIPRKLSTYSTLSFPPRHTLPEPRKKGFHNPEVYPHTMTIRRWII